MARHSNQLVLPSIDYVARRLFATSSPLKCAELHLGCTFWNVFLISLF